jgi:drug/metabolite transporter (DMT)-like permease
VVLLIVIVSAMPTPLPPTSDHHHSFKAALLLAFAAMSWGGLLQVAKPLLGELDPFWLNTIRYAISAPIFAAILVRQEGMNSLRFEGHALRLAFFGTVGFAGFGIVTLLGVRETRPEHAGLIVSMMPLVTALVGWLRGMARPSLFVGACMLMGLAGVLLTVTKGNAAQILNGSGSHAQWLVFAGVACWAVYTQSIAALPSWSALRYTSLSCLASLPGFALLTAGATMTGWTHFPDTAWLAGTAWRMTYIIAAATVLAMLSWSAGIRRLGPLNGVLFINLVPISAFVIGAVEGQQFSGGEWAGAALVAFSLLASNFYMRLKVHALRPA